MRTYVFTVVLDDHSRLTKARVLVKYDAFPHKVEIWVVSQWLEPWTAKQVVQACNHLAIIIQFIAELCHE